MSQLDQKQAENEPFVPRKIPQKTDFSAQRPGAVRGAIPGKDIQTGGGM